MATIFNTELNDGVLQNKEVTVTTMLEAINLENLAADVDEIQFNSYLKSIENVYDTYARFVTLYRIYSATAKCMILMNIASILYSITNPTQQDSLVLSLISISLNSMFDVDSRYKILSQLIHVYSDEIIPQINKCIYNNVGINLENIKKYKGKYNTSTHSLSINYLEQIEDIQNIVTNCYRRYMGEGFTMPVGLNYINYSSIILCITLYVCAFVGIPTLRHTGVLNNNGFLNNINSSHIDV